MIACHHHRLADRGARHLLRPARRGHALPVRNRERMRGYLFFLFAPVEIAFAYYLQGDISIPALIAVAIGTALFSQAIDYSIGLLMSNRFIDNLIGRKSVHQG
ncbi:MAG: hypothetical protein MZV63_33045 [Marinilabiliales bacterium]|nr:hypothetical protein [Marinilabiliales bacterium]